MPLFYLDIMTKIEIILEILAKIYMAISQDSNSRPLAPDESPKEETMTRQQVKDYLHISESTYKRKVKDGTLHPMRLPGGHLYFKSDLLAEKRISLNRGRQRN